MNILIIGATSDIAQATARIWAVAGHRLLLLGRHRERLERIAADLQVRGAESVSMDEFDAIDFDAHPALVDRAFAVLGTVDVVLVAHGSLGDQIAAEQHFKNAQRELSVNAVSVVSILTPIANSLEKQRSGAIVVIGSVAGDRGRQSNYVYGSAKAAVDVFVQGLRNRLYRAGVHVMLVKPGLIDTRMTYEFEKGPLWSAPESVGSAIVNGLAKRRNVVYAPPFWRLIMGVICSLPESVFKRLSL